MAKENIMTKNLKPGENSGQSGGIYQATGPRGGAKEAYATIPDNKIAPPTPAPNQTWKPIKITPKGKK